MFLTAGWRRFIYTLWAPFYNVLAWFFARARAESIRRLGLRPGERVLLVGAGTGLDLDFLPRDAAVTAIDLTPAMLSRLNSRADRQRRKVDARVMNAESMAFDDGTFDAVILHLVLAVVPDPVACAREAARVLRSGGRAVILDKFLPDDVSPPLIFRLAGTLASFFGTEITRQLGPILKGSGLTIVTNEPAALHGLFRIVLVEKGLLGDLEQART